jgi:hypothetical protein
MALLSTARAKTLPRSVATDQYTPFYSSCNCSGITFTPDIHIDNSGGGPSGPPLSVIARPSSVPVSALVYLPSVISNDLITLEGGLSYTSGTTFLPTIVNRITPINISASARVISPTLKLGSTIFVTTSLGSARTRSPSFGSFPSTNSGTTVIIGDPSLNKGIVFYPNRNTGVVLAGQIGIESGDFLINLGNNQWFKRR